MDADLLPECSGETWVASALIDELTVDLPAPGVGDDLVSDTARDKMLQTVRSWVVSGVAPLWSECAGLSPELRSWRLQVGNIKIDSEGRLWRRRSPPAVGSQLVIPVKKRRGFIREFHDSLFAGHLGITRTVYRLLDRVYWPGLRGDVRTYIKSCTICIARKSPCPRKVPMGHVAVGHRWERVAMDLLDMSVTTSRGNRYVLVIVDCFTRWTEAFPLPDKTAQSVADAFFNQVVCRFGMPAVIHSDQGREFENKILQELCLMGGSHKTRTAPYHPESDGMVERFNRTLLMMLAMFAGKNRDDWDDLLPADSSLLMVRGEMCTTVVVPGLQCDMTLVIASTGSEGLLGTEALQSCLPHQLDLRTGQLWANGQSTLQLHHQWQAVRASAYTERNGGPAGPHAD